MADQEWGFSFPDGSRIVYESPSSRGE
jgi:hypothetical protein